MDIKKLEQRDTLILEKVESLSVNIKKCIDSYIMSGDEDYIGHAAMAIIGKKRLLREHIEIITRINNHKAQLN